MQPETKPNANKSSFFPFDSLTHELRGIVGDIWFQNGSNKIILAETATKQFQFNLLTTHFYSGDRISCLLLRITVLKRSRQSATLAFVYDFCESALKCIEWLEI